MRCQYYFDFLCDIKSHYIQASCCRTIYHSSILGYWFQLMHIWCIFKLKWLATIQKWMLLFCRKLKFIELSMLCCLFTSNNTFAQWAMYQLIYRKSVQFVFVRPSWNPSYSHFRSHFLSVCDSVPKFYHYLHFFFHDFTDEMRTSLLICSIFFH